MGGRSIITRRDGQRIQAPNVLTMPRRAAAPGGVITDNLLAWWKHDEGSGLVLNDYQGSFDGDIQGANFWANNGPDGNPVGTYDGVNRFINGLGTGLGWSGTDSRTLVFAFRTDTVSSEGAPNALMNRRGTLPATLNQIIQQTLHLGGKEKEFVFSYRGDDDNMQGWYTTNFVLAVDTWYIATFTCTMGTPGDMKVYRNLTELTGVWGLGDGNREGKVIAGVNSLIGDSDEAEDDSGSGSGGGCKRWEGQMGDILIYDSILNLASVTQNFNALKDRYLL